MRDRICPLYPFREQRGTKSGKIDAMLYYSCVFNVVIINIIEIELFLLLLPIAYCATY